MDSPKRRIFIHEDHWGMRNLYPVAAYEEVEADMDRAAEASERNRAGGGWSDMRVIQEPSVDFASSGLTLASACAVLETIMPRVHIFDAALPHAQNDPYGSHEQDAYCFGIDENCFVKLEPRGDLVAKMWFEAPVEDGRNLAVLRNALVTIDRLAPCVVADYWVNAVGEVSDVAFRDEYFSLLMKLGSADADHETMARIALASTEEVLFLFGYHDGPIRGLAVGERCACWFDAPFRDDLDDYDSIFNVMYLRGSEVPEVERLFRGARLSDPMCRDPARQALVKEISFRFASMVESGSPEILRRKGSIRRHGEGGVRGYYSVVWEEPGE